MAGAAARNRAIDHLLSLQSARGDWEGEMVWCPMITAQYVIVQQIVGRKIDDAARAGLVRHFEVTRTAAGGWGLHPESDSYVFVTTLVYVALRLLGLDPDAPLAREARRWLRAQPGGVLAIPTWGKFWLALIDLAGWSGVNPVVPELLLLPRGLPFHPTRLYCHTRLIYLAMADLYGRRVRADLGPITAALRDELYDRPYDAIDFAAHRTELAASDVVARPGRLLRAMQRALLVWERVHPRSIRERAVTRCFARLLAEQRGSAWQGLSPVNALLNCVAIWSRDPRHPALAPSLDGLERWRWADDAEGVRYAGARSNAWDTAFAIRALAASDDGARRSADAIRRGCTFLRDTQILEELATADVADRDPAVGGWCFSDGAHRWPVSDCTAEAVSALLAARAPTDATRLARAAAFILSRQNADGGFGTYERRRGPAWLDGLNPSEMFRDCMTERSYVECTGSAVAALARLATLERDARTPELARAVARGVTFLRGAQAPDGAVRGFWGINFTYGIFHFVKGLRAAGVAADDPALARAAAWLSAHQRHDGGWGEHHTSCLTGRYVEHPESQVVMTSWALLALMDVIGPAPPVARGIAWLTARQRADGSWPRQAVNGVFFGSAMLDYRLYHAYFPAWALARYAALTSVP